MRVQFAISQPAAVDRSYHAIRQLASDGHRVSVSVQKSDAAADRLATEGIDHTVLKPTPRLGEAAERLLDTLRLSRYARRLEPDVIVGEPTAGVWLAARLTGASTVSWSGPPGGDRSALRFGVTESPAAGRYVPAAPRLWSAVARFHPDWFVPRETVRQHHGIGGGEPYAVAQFVAKASPYNAPQTGVTRRTKRQVVARLSEVGPVYVGNVDDPHPALDGTPISVPARETPHLADGASLLVTDSARVAVAGGLCGTPTVYTHVSDADVPDGVAELAARRLVRVGVGDSETVEAVDDLVADATREAAWERRAAQLFTAVGDPTAALLAAIDDASDGESADQPTQVVEAAAKER